jgi:hypothetical protein
VTAWPKLTTHQHRRIPLIDYDETFSCFAILAAAAGCASMN